LQVLAPGFDVMVYPEMGLPPSKPGAEIATTALPLPGTTKVIAGASGVVKGMAEIAADAGPEPMKFMDDAEIEYFSPLTRPKI